MATQLICNGCRVVLFVLGQRSAGTSVLEARELTVEGRRANNVCGGDPLPDGEFHWCERCARIAFKAVEDAHLKSVGIIR